jgi:N-acetylated-alpha-linked acidic dipeptidase
MVKYDILVPWPGPNPQRITLVEPERVEISVIEPPVPEDPDTYAEGALPPMAAYVTPGDVSGELVYANYGRIRDYRLLDEMGVSLEGRIVIVRYGGSPGQMRGMKVREAANRGAVGVIIYSDPQDDGYVRGDVYPEGRWRPPTGVQRGSYLDVPLYPGDPLTPFQPSIDGVERISMEEAANIQKIPAHPISYGEAVKLLRHIAGPVVPPEWQGGLPITYHIGPGPAKVEMHIEFDYRQRPVWNVFGSLRGAVEPDRFVLAAGHRDGWVLGARDPTSGAVSLLETARGIAEAVKQGFTPRRTIVIGSWGGEDFFLLGSTEWGEHMAEELQENMVIYINRESYTAGNWSASGNHSIEAFVIETARDAPHPSGKSLYEAWGAQRGGRGGRGVGLGPLGSGSDYTVFIDHLGVPSMSLGYGSGNGIYHSLYDTFDFYQRFGDPGYVYGAALADMVGRMIMRLANAEVLPFDFTGSGDAIAKYVDELIDMDTEGRLGSEMRRMAGANAEMRAIAATANAVYQQVLSGGAEWVEQNQETLVEVNALIMKAERDLIDERGLPRRPWYRNLVYAPGYYEGYAAKTLPGVREMMEDGMWDEARVQAGRLVEAIQRATTTLEEAAETARRAVPREVT